MTKRKNKSKTKSPKPQATTKWYTLVTTRDGHPVRELPPKTYDSLEEARRHARRLHDTLARRHKATTSELDDNLFVTGRYRSKVCSATHTTTDIGTISEGECHE